VPRDRPRMRVCPDRVAWLAGSIEDSVSGVGPEGEQDGAGEHLVEGIELGRRVLRVGPGQAQLRAEPGEGRTDQARRDQIPPTPQRPLGDHLLPNPCIRGPVEGLWNTVAMDTNDGLENRADCAPPFPEFGGRERDCRVIAEDDSQDRQVHEDLAGGQVGDALTMTTAVLLSTLAALTPGATDPGLLDQLGEIVRPALDDAAVDGELGGEYSLDSVPRATRSGSYQLPSRDRTPP
jgi:hypothetical protein